MEGENNRWLPAVVAVGVIAAAIPNFIFPSPLQLHLEGNMRGWIGLAVWAPAVLAGLAFFQGVELSERVREPSDSPWAHVMRLGAVMGWIVFLAVHFEPWWTQMGDLRPVDELQKALPLHAGLGALQVLFWQGIYQAGLAKAWTPAARMLGLAVLNAAVAAPFLMHASSMMDPMTHVVVPLVIWHVLLGVIAETGLSLRALMAFGAIFGGTWVWFQQALLI